MHMSLEILSDIGLQTHSVPGTRSIRYAFAVESGGCRIAAGESSATQNVYGTFLNRAALHALVPEAALRRTLMASIRQLLRPR